MSAQKVINLPASRDVEVITTHVNADFDALASMLAAAKLYPNALLVFPGSQERNLRNFYVESACYMYNFVKVKNVPWDRVCRLILVDTRQGDRIGTLAELVGRPGVEIHAYDHHPDSDTDIKTDYQVVEPVGATVTVLTRLLRESEVELSEDEATIMSLGIYEDTGSFTFPSTTRADFEAAAWLLEQGANLNVISSLITRELSAEEVGLLHDLIHSAHKIRLGGVEVVVSEVSRLRYMPDFAVLVHKFMDMDNLDAVFALARMEGRIYLVARSRLPQVDAGVIARALGGGGHPSAASATLKDMTLVEARDRLMSVLRAHVRPNRTAGDLMTHPVVSVPPDITVEEAHRLFNRYGLRVFPVVDGEELVGLIQQQTVDKAVTHGLNHLPVSEYMDEIASPLSPQAELAEVEQALLGQRQRLVPVMDQGRLVGVVTRTDLLNTLWEGHPRPEPAPGSKPGAFRQKQVAGLMRERLPRPVVEILRDLGRVADEMHYNLYLVGGSVRDLFLRRPNLDLDLVVEDGEGVEFARRAAEIRPGIKVRAHKKFHTAKLIFPDGLVIDVATARLEHYRAPASLPTVELSSLKMDLYRRDFTINTLAVTLNHRGFGRLIDFFGATRDLKEKVIRVLHNLSFVEDPTRVFRAVRFEQRFGFRIGKLTEGLIKNALKIDAFKRLSGDRLFGEMKQMFDEDRAAACFRRLAELDLLGQFHPQLKMEPKSLELWQGVDEALAWFRLSFIDRSLRQWLVYFLALADPLNDQHLMELCQRLGMGPRIKEEIIHMRRQALAALNRLQRNHPSPSVVYRLLQPLPTAFQLFVMAKAKREWVKRAVSRYLTSLAQTKPLVRGRDLLQMGFEPGPIYRRILDRVLDAQLDGAIHTKDEALELVRAEFGTLLEKTA